MTGGQKVPSQREFQDKLNNYIATQETYGWIFDDKIKSRPTELATVLYTMPLNTRSKKRKEELMRVLTVNDTDETIEISSQTNNQLSLREEEGKLYYTDKLAVRINFLDRNAQINLYQAIPELSDFFDWIQSTSFLNQEGIIQDTNQSLIDTFQETQAKLDDHHLFTQIVSQTRNTFLNKMKKLLDPGQYQYLLGYTTREIEKNHNKDRTYKINICVPLSTDELTKFYKQGNPYSIEMLEKILPLFYQGLKKAFGGRSYRQIHYKAALPHVYETRKRNLAQTHKQWESGSKVRQEELFPQEIKKPYEHSGISFAFHVIRQRIQGQTDLGQSNIPGIVLQSDKREIDKEDAIQHFQNCIHKAMPWARVKELDCEQFYKTMRQVGNRDDSNEDGGQRMQRIHKRAQTILDKDIYILRNIEGLTNKIFTQELLLAYIFSIPHKKFLAISNTPINQYKPANISGKYDNGKTIYKNGFHPLILQKLQEASIATIEPANPKECGELLVQNIRSKTDIDLPRQLIRGIGSIIAHPPCYEALSQEILAICNHGQTTLTLDMAQKIVKNRAGEISSISMDDILDEVTSYIQEQDRQGKNIKIRQYTAYIAKYLPTKDQTRRTNQEIASFLQVAETTVASYINVKSRSEDMQHINHIKRNIEARRGEKEKRMLLGF